MKQIICEMCGGKDLIKQDSVFVCQNCQAKYSVEEAKKMMVETDDTEKQSSSSLDLGSSTTPKKPEKSFFTKPLAPNGSGCGCLPAVFTSPIFIIAFVVLVIIGVIITPEESQTQNVSNIEDQKIKARVQLEQTIKANLREPKSYQNTATDVWTLGEYIFVKNTFRGKNRYGGYEVCTFVAQFNFNAKPPEWEITNKPSSNNGCRAIMIALP